MKSLGNEEQESEMKIVCAWCGKDMGEKDSDGVEGISHGVCEQCLKELKAETTSQISAEDGYGEYQTRQSS